MMAGAISPVIGRRDGIARVCRAWEAPKSLLYAARRPAAAPGPTPTAPARRDPSPPFRTQPCSRRSGQLVALALDWRGPP